MVETATAVNDTKAVQSNLESTVAELVETATAVNETKAEALRVETATAVNGTKGVAVSVA